MKYCTLLTTVLSLAASASHAESTAFVNVNVIPMTSEEVVPARTVIVVDGRIAAIGDVDNVPVPDDALVVDGTDRFLLPGLAEMHGHVPGAGAGLERTLHLYVVNGITTVRGMLGQPSHLELRSAIHNRDVLGPRLYTAGPSLNGRSV